MNDDSQKLLGVYRGRLGLCPLGKAIAVLTKTLILFTHVPCCLARAITFHTLPSLYSIQVS